MAASAQKPVQGLFSSSLFTTGPGSPSKALRFWVGGLGEVGGVGWRQRQCVGVRRDATWRALLGFLRERENVPHTHTHTHALALTDPPVSGTIR